MDESTLVQKFMNADMQLTKGALEILRNREDAELAIDRVFEELAKMDKRPFMITPDIITKILETQPQIEKFPAIPSPVPAPEVKVEPKPEVEVKRLPELTHVKFKPHAADYEARVEVLRDVTGRSYSEGEIKDFVALFRDRYERLSNLLRKRVELQDAVPIGNLNRVEDGEQVKVIGMVSDKRESSTGNVILELEDPTGRISAFIFKGRKELMRKAAEIVLDEVIGVIGSLRGGDGGQRIFVGDIIWPDLPIKHEVGRAEDPLCAALISDLHVGSEMFMEELFAKFIKWLRGENDLIGQQELASRVKYIVIAGDVVDGIGVYPRQEEELLISDIFKQYEVAAKLLEQIPEYIKIIIAPGNHDAVRPAEPQPAIPKSLAGGLYSLNSVMVGNPVKLSLHGVNFLIYHGRSFDDIVSAVPGLDRHEPTSIMIKLLQKRHLAPIYGGRAAISPERNDYMVIDEPPDVFHCGHVHVQGYVQYRDISVINSGTFQGMTNYMRQLGVVPTPGLVPVIDLQTHKTEVIKLG